MRRNNDPLVLTPHWHVDCRLVAELPEDRVVSVRFLVNLPFGAMVVALALTCGWLIYANSNLRFNIADWDRRLAESRAEVGEIKKLQRDYGIESTKLDLAAALYKSPLLVSAFTVQLSHTRPEHMTIDTIESNDAGVVVRGTLREASERASRSLQHYIGLLQADPNIGPHFKEIALTGLDRRGEANLLSFEISFRQARATP